MALLALGAASSNSLQPSISVRRNPSSNEIGLGVVARCDNGLEQVIRFVRSKPELFSRERTGLYNHEEKKEIWNTWKRFLEYQLALESIVRAHSTYYELDGTKEIESFYQGYAAALVQYRYALEFLELTEGNGTLDRLLDEPVPEIGLEDDSYSQMRFRFLNAGRGVEFAARQIVFAAYSRKKPATEEAKWREHSDWIWKMGRGTGQKMTLRNAGKIARRSASNIWLPIQTGLSEWMGDTKVYRVQKSLISPEQIAGLKLQPGDIMLQRRDWYLSNVGLPGFWPHAAIYIGTSNERRRFFDDPEVRDWVKEQGESSGEFEKLLESRYVDAYQWAGREEDGHAYRVLEAISEGVVFTTLEHSAAADTMAVLRPRLTTKAKAMALFRAFYFVGRPYDFNFDFDTDASLVCTELVCKSYEPQKDSAGLEFPVESMLGRKVVPANLIVEQFDSTYGTASQQLELVHFLDANEKAKRSIPSTVEEFRKSWKRPKWHVFLQNQ